MDRQRRKEDFADRFGLSESIRRRNLTEGSQSSEARPDELGAVFRPLSRIIVKELMNEGKSTGLFSLIDKLGLRIEEALPVITWMEEHGYLKVLDRPRNGNWTIEATPEGNKLLA